MNQAGSFFRVAMAGCIRQSPVMHTRREFIGNALAGICGIAAWSGCSTIPNENHKNQIITVSGSIDANGLGRTLSHEHVMVDFIGAEKTGPHRYKREDVFDVALPHLLRIKELGCKSLIECTPAYIGRDPLLLKDLAQSSGLNLLTNTGYYGAAQNKFLPQHAYTETANQLADRWIREFRDGIEETGVRPGFIKIGVDSGRLSELHQKLVHAAALTHTATGLTIAAHTGNGIAALDELRILRDAGVHGSAFIWVHAQSESNPDIHTKAAEQGAWVEFDGIAPSSIAQHVKLVQAMRDRGFLGQVLLSHDAGWYHVGEPKGGYFRPFDTLFTEFLPALAKAGFTELEIAQLLEFNPREAFTIRRRTAG